MVTVQGPYIPKHVFHKFIAETLLYLKKVVFLASFLIKFDDVNLKFDVPATATPCVFKVDFLRN